MIGPIEEFFNFLLSEAATHSLEGILIISFVFSMILFIPAPYFIAVVIAAIAGLDPVLIALYSTVGATLAKIVIFKLSYFGRGLVSAHTRNKIRPFEKLVSRYGWLAAFIAALTPIPDDLIYVPLGFARYSFWRFSVATFVGKFILTLTVALGAALSLDFVELLVGELTELNTLLMVGVAFAAVAAIILYVITRLDWDEILGRWFPWTVESNESGGQKSEMIHPTL